MKSKKIPQRMCIACRTMKEKGNMLRIVRTPTGEIKLDTVGKVAGRGAYICDESKCIETCIKKKLLNKVFSCEIPEEIYDYIREEYANYKQS